MAGVGQGVGQAGSLPDMREKKQVTVRMTEQFADDLNLIMQTYALQNASFVVQQSVAAQADAIRERRAGRPTPYADALQAPYRGAIQGE